MSDTWQKGQRVHVFMDLGEGQHAIQTGTIRKIENVGPIDSHPERCVQVKFDDELIFGGTGIGWVSYDQLTTAG